ncbi:phage head closure protein [Hyphococcus flavus]|uniref:Phage head closure protein n=1 Tax=Hyphococcus flavus TaxID=1866326 RepID=A0AAE9ZIH7_9PROT|nr:phage head closure protein [Hyphococcus flavus]WDI31596.1 phage head closure protein [Hyphococcus flavus]
MKSMEIRASQLRERITLLKPTETKNAGNETVTTFEAFATVSAEIEEGGGREFYGADKLNAEKKIRAKIYFRTDVDVKWRFIWNAITFRIHDVQQIRHRKGLILNGAQNLSA